MPFFLGEVLGEHPAAVAVRAGAVHRAHRAREGLDMMEILAGIGAQRVERQPAFGPRLVEGMLEHRPLRDLGVDRRRSAAHAGLPVWLRGYGAIASASRLNQSQRGELAVKPRRKRAEAAAVVVAARRIRVLEIAPALVRAPRHRRDQLELGRADDVDPAVLAVLEAQDFDAGDQPVLDDPVERCRRSARPTRFGPHPGRRPESRRRSARAGDPLLAASRGRGSRTRPWSGGASARLAN